jgi:hypothetical protein
MRRFNTVEANQRIEEFCRARGNPGADPALVAEAALFVEEVFGLMLSDEEICSARLGTAAAISELVISKLAAER